MIPTYEKFQQPILHALADGKTWQVKDLRELIAGPEYFNFSAEERSIMVGSGNLPQYQDRIGWAISYLFHAGLLERPKRGFYKISHRGLEALNSGEIIDDEYLKQFQEFREFIGKGETQTEIDEGVNLPDYSEFRRKALKAVFNYQSLSRKEIDQIIIGKGYLDLTEEQKSLSVINTGRRRYKTRIGWAVTYLYQAGLLQRPKRGIYEITERGLEALKSNVVIDNNYLEQFEEFRAFKNKTNKRGLSTDFMSEQSRLEVELTPEETIQESIRLIHKELSSELLEEILAKDAFFFEDLVVKLLYKMGYGSHVDRAKVTKRSGDDGIDGIISSDRLGLDTIYVQAKRYATDNIVGNNQIRDFMGALLQKGATKGVFITTSDFSDSAKRAVRENRHQVIALINGQQLTSLMIEYNLGVSIEREIHIKRLDSDFFDENF